MITTIFFDLDGVLTLENKGSVGTCASLCKAIPSLNFDTVLHCYKTHFGHLTTQQGSFANRLKEFGNCIGEHISIEQLHEALTDVTENTEMITLATQLKSQYTVGIITNNSSERMRLLEQNMNLPAVFDPIIVSGDVRCAKADGTTTIFELALQQAGCEPHEAVFIDNAKRNLDIPKQMGIHTYWHDDEINDVQQLQQQLTVYLNR